MKFGFNWFNLKHTKRSIKDQLFVIKILFGSRNMVKFIDYRIYHCNIIIDKTLFLIFMLGTICRVDIIYY